MTEERSSTTSYSALITQLNEVLSGIERDEIGVDELTASIEKAYGLVSTLRSRLGETEARLEKIVAVHEQTSGEVGSGEESEDE